MAAYVRQQGQIVLILSKAEATALQERIEITEDAAQEVYEIARLNGEKSAALDRAKRALSIACEAGSRSGAAIQ
jgi:Arc/MetJ family transcription regulator